jgi:SUF system FeS assembly protein, NifU family
MDNNLKREIILDNYQNPMNRGLIKDESYIKINTRSTSCVDNIDMMAKIKDGKIVDVKFDGEACAICTSATSLIIRTLIGKTVEDAKGIISNYERMINEEPYDEEVLEELQVYNETYKQPSRKRCALLPAESMKKIMNISKEQ